MTVGREDLEIGGTCYLRIGFDGAGSNVKLKRAQVVDVLRAAARLRLCDTGRELTVRFNNLEPDHDYLRERAQRDQARRDRLREDSIVPPPPPTLKSPQPSTGLKLLPPPPEPEQPREARSDLDSWLEMGRDVLGPLEQDIAETRATKEALEAERIAIDDQLGELVKRLVELDRKRAALQRFLKDFRAPG